MDIYGFRKDVPDKNEKNLPTYFYADAAPERKKSMGVCSPIR